MAASHEADGAGSYRFLIVDDHPDGREGMRMIVESEPAFLVVGEAASGEEAIDAVARLAPQIVLMDVNMPGMGGLEATQRIKQLHPSIVIVIVTVEDDITFLFEALKRGAQGYLLKNLQPSAWQSYLRAIAFEETPMDKELAHLLLREFTGGSEGRDLSAGMADVRDDGMAPEVQARVAWNGALESSINAGGQGTVTGAGGTSAGGTSAGASASARRGAVIPSQDAGRKGGVTPLTQREREVLERVARGESNREVAAGLGLSEHTVKNHMKNIMQKLHLDNRVQLSRFAYENGLV